MLVHRIVSRGIIGVGLLGIIIFPSPAQDGSRKTEHFRSSLSAIQAVVLDVSGKLLNVSIHGSPTPHGRQVDISSATYESADGKVVSPYPLHIGDHILLVVDPHVPILNRPKKRSGPVTGPIQLLPLRALIIELITAYRHTAPIGADKG